MNFSHIPKFEIFGAWHDAGTVGHDITSDSFGSALDVSTYK